MVGDEQKDGSLSKMGSSSTADPATAMLLSARVGAHDGFPAEGDESSFESEEEEEEEVLAAFRQRNALWRSS